MFKKLKKWLMIKDLPKCGLCGLMSDNLQEVLDILDNRDPALYRTKTLHYHKDCLKAVTTNPEKFSDEATLVANEIVARLVQHRDRNEIRRRSRELRNDRLKYFAANEKW